VIRALVAAIPTDDAQRFVGLAQLLDETGAWRAGNARGGPMPIMSQAIQTAFIDVWMEVLTADHRRSPDHSESFA
jgi:hypothetical protein